MRKVISQQARRSQQFMHYWPVGAVVVLTLVLVCKWTIAKWLMAKEPASVANVNFPHLKRAIQPELLLGGIDSDIAPRGHDGVWSMPGSDWNFANETVSTLKLDDALHHSHHCDDVGSDKAEHLSLIDLLPEARAKTKRVGRVTTRSVDFGNARTSVIYREQGGRKSLIAAKIANQIDADRWQLITLSPKILAFKSDHLLPFDGMAADVCQRLDKSGTLQYEIVETACCIEELLRTWCRHGWSVQPLEIEEVSKARFWTCVKGAQSVQVRAIQDAELSGVKLVLTALHNL